MNRTIRTAALALAGCGLIAGATAAAAAAHGEAPHRGTPHTMPVKVQFTAVNGTAPVTCATPVTGLGTTSATAVLTDLRFYISNVRLVRRNGTSVPLTLTGPKAVNATANGERVTLIDLEDGTGSCAAAGDRATNAVISGTVPEGRYVGARMYMGVPFRMNHTDVITAPRPLDGLAMNWSWQSGRKFAKIELADPAGSASSWASRAFLFHLGSTGCVGDPIAGQTVNCGKSNRMAIRLATFDPATQRIAVDLGALTAGNDITVNRAGAPGCMSGPTDPECGPVFAALGLGLGSGRPVAGGASQTLFRAIPR